ncbi:zinc ribbon domain-containing protein [Hyphomicrobium sp.]|uniref:zinc ribbon domain-containing protein n=1 Tax=Hyphomicrobium sp. TaxID=82 RepID=UPI000FAE273B|nr:zinc ribbon domain-containing protein [Hyphomicrobium sp.]RUO99987.1 MAG: zinc ribbon domain-containing protein [Hyphomicrobium sp.]
MADSAAQAGTANARFCSNCGAALHGKFCGACGSPAGTIGPSSSAEHVSEGWGSLTSEFLSSHGSNGVFAVALSFLLRPVDTIIRLTDDPTYRSQWGFLTATVGAQLTLSFVILPRVYAALFNLQNTADSSEVIRNEVVQYIGMAILTPIQFYICRWLGTRRRTPMSYVKLCVLSVSYGAILWMLASLVFFVVSVALLKNQINFDFKAFWEGLVVLTLLGVLVFVTASHRRFWGMSWPIAIGVTLLIAALSWLVVYPGLGMLITRGGIAGVLSGVVGG